MLVIAAGLLKDWLRLVWQVSRPLGGGLGLAIFPSTFTRSITDQVCPHYSPLNLLIAALIGPPFASTPYIVPVTAPVTLKKTGRLEVSAKAGVTVMIKVMLPPDALLKRPVPPVA